MTGARAAGRSGLLRGANIDDSRDAARIVAEAGYWAHQLRYVLAAHAATAAPAGHIRDAAEAARSKNAKGPRAHLRARQRTRCRRRARTLTRTRRAKEMFVDADGRAIFADGLERLRRLVGETPEKLQGRWASKLPSVFSRDALRLSAEGLHWVLDLLVTKTSGGTASGSIVLRRKTRMATRTRRCSRRSAAWASRAARRALGCGLMICSSRRPAAGQERARRRR